jgi:hypothetical protein
MQCPDAAWLSGPPTRSEFLKRFTRLSVAAGAGLTLSLALLAPAATADDSAAVTAGSPDASGRSADSKLTDLLPADWQERRDAAQTRFGIEPSPAQEALERVINPGDYECGPTDLDFYVDELLAGMTAEEITFLVTSGAMEFPTYDALIFGSDTDPQYALEDYSTLLQGSFRDAKRFWDIDSSDIQLHAMHGDMLLDEVRVARLLVVLYGFPEADAATYAATVADFIAAHPVFDGGDHPIFTLNAYAFTAEGETDPFFSTIPDKLVFGDGILDALSWMGIGNVGSRVVLGHEFGHHIQFELNLFDSPLTGPEATRRTELMADSYGTYWGTHARGLSLNTKRVLQAVRTFYVVGDCAFDNPGHHGTPNQRLRAAEWGAELADSARPQGRILSAQTVADLFEEELPDIVAPDAA